MSAQKFGQGEGLHDWTRRIQDIMDEMRNRSFCDYRASGAWIPTVNIYERAASYLLCVELAGFDLDTLEIRCVDAKHLSIAGERARPRAPGLAEAFTVELMEIDEGPFHREIDFEHAFDVAGVQVAYDRGYVWITLRKLTTP